MPPRSIVHEFPQERKEGIHDLDGTMATMTIAPSANGLEKKQ